MSKGIVSAKELACYIIDYYIEKFGKEISPIKLQKSLYFCFAYWGGFVRKSKLADTEITINKSDWLFDEDIEAWVYGPVVPDVYHDTNLMSNKNENLFNISTGPVFVKRKCEQKGPKKVSTFSTRFHVVSNVFPKYQMLTF